MKNIRQSVIGQNHQGFLALGILFALFITGISEVNLHAARNKGKIKAQPKPANDPKVKAAQKKYNTMKNKAAEARQKVMAKRNELQKILRGSGESPNFALSKPEEVIEAESALKQAETMLDSVRQEQLEKLDDNFYSLLLADFKSIELALEKAGQEVPINEVERQERIFLNLRLFEKKKQIKDYELKILANNEPFQAALAVVQEKKRTLASYRQEMSEERKAAASAAKQSQQNNPLLSSAKSEIEKAVSAYSKAYEQQQSARRALATALESSAAKYKQYLSKLAARKQKERMDRFRRQNRYRNGRYNRHRSWPIHRHRR